LLPIGLGGKCVIKRNRVSGKYAALKKSFQFTHRVKRDGITLDKCHALPIEKVDPEPLLHGLQQTHGSVDGTSAGASLPLVYAEDNELIELDPEGGMQGGAVCCPGGT
jgi:hypothetical protein